MIKEGFDSGSWFAGICKECGSNVVITQPNAKEYPHDDYWWYCSNKECHNHQPGEHTGDMEKPDWVEYVKDKEKDDGYGKYTFNLFNCERWGNGLFDTKEDAIKEGMAYAKNDDLECFWIGKTKKPSFNPINIDLILERAADSLAYEVGDDLASEWYQDIPIEDVKKLEEKLKGAFGKWMQATDNQPKCYSVVDIERIEVKDGGE